MLQFAVSIEGVTKDGEGQWVLAVDPVGERLLTAHADGLFHWHPMADCRLFRFINPEAPQPVLPMQPAQKPKLVMPPVVAVCRPRLLEKIVGIPIIVWSVGTAWFES